MKSVIIVQARMASSRLPGKVMKTLAGRPMLTQLLRRLKCCRAADDIAVATTTGEIDDPVVACARREDVRWFRGSETDVLSRYVGAAGESQAEIVVRVTADCPLIDPGVTDRVIAELRDHRDAYDYSANVVHRTFPIGLDTEALWHDTLTRLARLATSVKAREHVTFFITTERPDLFSVCSVTDDQDNSHLRWTVDSPEDFAMVERLYAALGLGEDIRPYREVLAYVKANPAIAAINAHVPQKWAG